MKKRKSNMWTIKMVKFLFGIFALSAGLGWSIVGAVIAELSGRVDLVMSSFFIVIGWITLVGGLITSLLGVFILWNMVFDFIKDQTYNTRNPSYTDKE
jgi:UPF0716 family protein affecting phage T7 exclusion